ncbi:MAG: DUF373 family protein [Thermoplasmata archaeon]|jgi:putative membrane protein
MLTLIISVDRDNDVGRKTGESGPVIGRDENLRVANKLILADPEDSDANAIFGAISIYDSLKNEGKEVEVVTLTGDVSVGLKSDEKIREQLLLVKEKLNPKDAILVSDGEEDEFILPVITSIVPVIHVKRIIVKQSKGLESSYYILVKALRDEKVARKIMVPIALIFLAYSISVFGLLVWKYYFPSTYYPDPGTFGFAFVLFTLGMYFLLRGFRVGTRISNLYSRFKNAFIEAKISITSDLLAIFIVIFGIISSFDSAILIKGLFPSIALFFQNLVLWIVFGVVVREAGLAFDTFFHKKGRIRGYLIGISLVIGLGILVYGSIMYIRVLLSFLPTSFNGPSLIIIAMGLSLSIFSSVMGRILYEGEEDELQ